MAQTALCMGLGWSGFAAAQLLDTGFNPGSGANDWVQALAVQADGRVLLGGYFAAINGTARMAIARLNADGTVDTGFDPGTGAFGNVTALAVQADGRVLVGGNFTDINGVARNRIARLDANGSVDSGFDSSSGSDYWVSTIALQADGRVLLGGGFTNVNSSPRNRIARLNADGSLDTGFDAGSAANEWVHTIVVQPDGRVLVGGTFTAINGTLRNRIARLNANGSLDTGFDPGSGANERVYALAVQADGRVLLGGQFTAINGVARHRVARLNADGSLDTTYDPGSGPDAGVQALAVQADGRVVLGGYFTNINSTARNYIARLATPDAAVQALSLAGRTVRWLRSGSTAELALPPTLAFSISGAPGTFSSLGTMTRITGGWQLAVPTLPVAQTFFVQAEGTTTSGLGNGSSGRVQSTASLFLADVIFANGYQ